ncbi:MAG: hypothetical protein Fur0037_22880 [Planctomycetota bacterium]
MVKTSLCVPFVAALSAALAAQSPGTPENRSEMAPSALSGAPGGGLGALSFERLRELSRQEPDYSLRGLFLQEHGDFVLKSERYSPMAEFSLALLPNYEIQNEPGSFDMIYARADIEYPLTVAPDGYLILGAYGSNRHYEAKAMSGFGDDNLSSAGVKLGFGAFLDRDVLLEVKIEPGLWSDMDGSFKHQDYDMPGSAIVTWRAGDDAFFKLGMRYNQVYKEAPWLPYLGVSWAINENFRIDVMLPETVEVSWWPESSLGFLLGVDIDGAQYRMRTSAATGRQRANAQVQEIVAYCGLISRMSDNFSLIGRAGANVAGDYHLTNGDASGGFADGTLDPGLFAEISFGIDF